MASTVTNTQTPAVGHNSPPPLHHTLPTASTADPRSWPQNRQLGELLPQRKTGSGRQEAPRTKISGSPTPPCRPCHHVVPPSISAPPSSPEHGHREHRTSEQASEPSLKGEPDLGVKLPQIDGGLSELPPPGPSCRSRRLLAPPRRRTSQAADEPPLPVECPASRHPSRSRVVPATAARTLHNDALQRGREEGGLLRWRLGFIPGHPQERHKR